MYLFGNELPSLIVMDILTSIAVKVKDHLYHKPKHVILGHSTAVLRQWQQMKLYENDEERERELTAPSLPILSIIPNDLQPDQAPFAWHRDLASVNRRMGFCVVRTDDFMIRYVPYLYTIRFSMIFTGRSFPDVTDAKIAIEELFSTRQMNEYEITSLIALPVSAIESVVDPSILTSIQSYIPKSLIKLIGEERYTIPFQLRYFLRCMGQSENSQLFGEQGLPNYSVSFDFELIVNLPTKVYMEYAGKILQIDCKIHTNIENKDESKKEDHDKNDVTIVEQTDLEVDSETGSFIIHTILKAEEH